MRHIKFLLYIIVLLPATSCYHVYYAPNTPNVSLLTEKNELRVNAGLIVGMESEFAGGDLQLAYAPAPHLGVMVNGFKASNTDQSLNDFPEQGRGSYGELGIGYFTAVDPKKNWLFEVYGGLGKGSVRNEYGDGDHSKVGITKLFLQPAFGYKWNYIEVALAPRISHVNWKIKEAGVTDVNTVRDMEAIAQHPNFISFEPAVIFRGGGKKVKAQLGLTLANNEWYNSGQASPRETSVVFLGLSFNLNTKAKQPAALDVKVP